MYSQLGVQKMPVALLLGLEDGFEEARLSKVPHRENLVEYLLKLKNSVMLLSLFKLTERAIKYPNSA